MKTAQEILNEYGCPDIPYDENVAMNYRAIIEAMEAHAASQAVLFAQWCSEGMWTKHENGRGREEVQLWYNTYRYEKMAAPLTGEELYEMFLTQTK